MLDLEKKCTGCIKNADLLNLIEQESGSMINFFLKVRSTRIYDAIEVSNFFYLEDKYKSC